MSNSTFKNIKKKLRLKKKESKLRNYLNGLLNLPISLEIPMNLEPLIMSLFLEGLRICFGKIPPTT